MAHFSPSRASVISLAACNSASEGMQPTCKQAPPGFSAASMSVTFIPLSAARNAAAYPPGPAPKTTRSLSVTSGMDFPLLQQHQQRVFQHLRDSSSKAGGGGAVNHAVIVRQG